MVFYLAYVSSATEFLDRADLEDILVVSRRNNARLGISGALLYRDGNLMQVLEGDEDTVRHLYAKLGRDPRHRGLITLLEGHDEERQFADWSMAFRDLDRVDRTTPGYSQFLNTSLAAQEFGANPTLCQQLLESFKETLSPVWSGGTSAR